MTTAAEDRRMSYGRVFRLHDGHQFRLRRPAPASRTCVKQSHFAEDILQQLMIHALGDEYALWCSHPPLR